MNYYFNINKIKSISNEFTEDYLNFQENYDLSSFDIDENDFEITVDDIVDEQGDLYEQFAVMYVNEKEQQKTAKDKDEEKREQTKIQDKSEAGV